MNNTTALTSSPVTPEAFSQVMYRFGLVMCIITSIITIIGLVKHKKNITIRAIIGFVLSIVYTIIFYNQL